MLDAVNTLRPVNLTPQEAPHIQGFVPYPL
jgi:hypothetical protein